MANKPQWRASTPIPVKHGDREVGTRWCNIGAAWDRPDGSIMLVLDAAPLRTEYVYLFKWDDGPSKVAGGGEG